MGKYFVGRNVEYSNFIGFWIIKCVIVVSVIFGKVCVVSGICIKGIGNVGNWYVGVINSLVVIFVV